jgi:hypothetical protein
MIQRMKPKYPPLTKLKPSTLGYDTGVRQAAMLLALMAGDVLSEFLQ